MKKLTSSRICNDLESGCDHCCSECDVPAIEPEDCGYCLQEAEENDFEYEANFIYSGGCWYCDNCRRPV